MPLLKRCVIHVTFLAKQYQSLFGCCLVFIASLLISISSAPVTNAASCPDLKIIFARGSGAKQYDNKDYKDFKSSLESKLKDSTLSYEFEDLEYPAIGVSGDNIPVAIGAFISGGEAYSFGDSVKQGIINLANTVNDSTCKNTKYVIAGYSQGAMVISKSLESLNSDRIIFAATFGDPKIYLPEGAGPLPVACKGEGLSDYRVYVPDCYAYKGLLGAKEPYASLDYLGKLGTWCNKFDIFCSSHFSISSHTSYVNDHLYEDASRLIFSKIATAFSFTNSYISPHDTAILIDSTGSMSSIISKYKSEALELAEKTLNSGGRVALYDYRDLKEGYYPVERCNFETCDLETFKQGLNEIRADGGGDSPESLLSSSFQVMKNLKWQLGSTKSLVILTDASYHSPDLDGTTFYDVQTLSKQIDPVNFYIITTDKNLESYQSLAAATDGKVVSTADDLSILTNNIIERFDSLPRVEESSLGIGLAPRLSIDNVEPSSSSEVKISFTTSGEQTIVVLNEAILGITDQQEIVLTDLDPAISNNLSLIPLNSNRRGEAVSVNLELPSSNNTVYLTPTQPLPKAPNTGRQ